VGQVELVLGKGDGRVKSHLLCPDEGSCLQKVNQQLRAWAQSDAQMVSKHQGRMAGDQTLDLPTSYAVDRERFLNFVRERD